MTHLEWLLKGDPVIVHLVKTYLLDGPSSSQNKGFIKKYLDRYNKETLTWGKGYYSPKWVSTHYTLLDLKYMEVMPDTLEYQESLMHYVTYYLESYLKDSIEKMDLCITGMVVNLMAYGNIHHKTLNQCIDYILDCPMSDGGWNCLWNHPAHPHIASVHTTINVLEGLAEYQKQGYTYRIKAVEEAIKKGINCLFSRELRHIKNTDTPLNKSVTHHHFPFRWKYDYLRVLEFLAKQKIPRTPAIDPALKVLERHIRYGRLTKGSTHPGRIHFPLELERYGRFNTLRAYIVLKTYNPKLYNTLLTQDI